MSTRVIINYITLCLVWGTTWFAMKISLNYGTPPLFGAGIRFFLAGIILITILLIRRERLPLNRRAVILYIQFGLLNFVVSYSLSYWAVQYVYSNVTSLVWAGFPVAVSLFPSGCSRMIK
ncbi:MAG: EamA family transporter [Fidelibacterota bacterium]